MNDYNKELDKLFVEWDKASKKNGLDDFCHDGLMLKGEIFQGENGFWGRKSGNENELWHNAKKKILFLVKDVNGPEEGDIRGWIGRQNEDRITGKFHKNVALWLYGLNSFSKSGSYKSFEEANDYDKNRYTKAFDDLPIAIVNCKKESGKGSISNDVLFEHASVYGKYLKKQIQILDPDIIVCGGGSGTVLKIAKEIIYPNMEFINFNESKGWIHYNKETGKVLIDSYHPTCRKSYKSIYDWMMEAYNEYLIKKN